MNDSQSSDGARSPAAETAAEITARHEEYWRRNIRYVGMLVAVWFAVSYLCGIVFAEALNQFTLPGTNFPLGFWFAQQGAIDVFVVEIFVYVWLMNRLDREFQVDEGSAA